MKKQLLIVCAILCITQFTPFGISDGFCQMGIGTNTPDSSAILELQSSDKGILIPRSDTGLIAAPAIGLLIYQISDNNFYYFNGTIWASALGAAGTNGINGTTGPAGAAGPTGPTGATGTAGTNGTDGVDGIDGAPGAAGPTGATGLAGSDGSDGADGAAGPTGAIGAAGSDGTDGIDGAVGPTGATGLTGAAGPTGATGPTGADGALNAWSLTGNAGLNPTTNFIGTSDNIPLAFRTNNLERMRIDSSTGHVGIGITNPTSKLSIVTDSDDQGGEGSLHGLIITTGTNYQTLMMGYDGTDDVAYINAAKTGSAEPLVLQTRGSNVGIGTTGPDQKLDVLDSSNPQLRLSQADGTVFADFQMDSNGDLLLAVDNQANQLVLDNGGNVGIGTATPGSKLSVSGGGTFGSTLKDSVMGNGDVAISGNLGIGITSPGSPLHVVKDQENLLQLTRNTDTQDGTAAAGILFGVRTYPTIQQKGAILFKRTGGYGRGDLVFALNNVDDDSNASLANAVMVLQDNGNVGIGMTGASRKLDVLDTSNAQLRLSQANGTVFADFHMESNGDLLLTVDGQTNQLVLDNGGSVGIGTASPTSKLSIIAATDDQGGETASHGLIIQTDSLNQTLMMGYDKTDDVGYINVAKNGSIEPLTLQTRGGPVGIGNTNPMYELDVIGDIRATGSVYYGGTVGNTDGTLYAKPDFVFEDGYVVMSTNEVEKFLKREGHLPWLTSAKKDLKENEGAIDMTRMGFQTVETAENLQLQIILLSKLVAAQKKELDDLKKIVKNRIK